MAEARRLPDRDFKDLQEYIEGTFTLNFSSARQICEDEELRSFQISTVGAQLEKTFVLLSAQQSFAVKMGSNWVQLELGHNRRALLSQNVYLRFIHENLHFGLGWVGSETSTPDVAQLTRSYDKRHVFSSVGSRETVRDCYFMP